MNNTFWLEITPNTGSGNGVVIASATKNTGREPRIASIAITADFVKTQERQVIQAGAATFAKFNKKSIFANRNGESLSVRGKANASALRFELGENTYNFEMANTYNAAGITVDNGGVPTIPLGATSEYEFEIIIKVPKNETGAQLEVPLSVYSLEQEIGGVPTFVRQDSCVICSTEQGNYVIVSEEPIKLDADGTSVSFEVKSNTTWYIS